MKPTVLVVDDEPTNIIMVSQILKDDYRIIAATSAEQALERIKGASSAIDIILLDINLPGMTGLEAAKAIKALPQTINTPLLLLATPSHEELAQALDIGIIDIVEKPIEPLLLRQRVKNTLALHQI